MFWERAAELAFMTYLFFYIMLIIIMIGMKFVKTDAL